MPKIMFRPNATPPPFVPPTPPINKDSVKFNPSSFSEGQTINATVFNIESPEDHDSLCFGFHKIGAQYVYSSPFSHSDESIEQLSVSFETPCASNDFSEVALIFLVDGEQVGTVDLNIID